jgi:hypothetical protein
MRPARRARPSDSLRAHGKSQSLQHGEGARRLPRVRSSEAERRGTECVMRPGPRGVCCGSPVRAQPVGRRPQAGRLFGEPAAWRPAAVWSSSGERRHEAASGARPAGLGGPGGAGGGGRTRAGVALAGGLQRKPHDSAVGERRRGIACLAGVIRLSFAPPSLRGPNRRRMAACLAHRQSRARRRTRLFATTTTALHATRSSKSGSNRFSMKTK